MVDRGLKPAAISWKGAKGFAFMYFDTRANNLPSATSGGGEELVEKLKDLKIGDTVLNIEQDRRSSKKNSTKDGAVEKVSDAEEVTTWFLTQQQAVDNRLFNKLLWLFYCGLSIQTELSSLELFST